MVKETTTSQLSELINDTKFIKKVQYVLIVLFLIIIALDIYLALDAIDDNTISNVIKDTTDNGFFALTYLWGAIAANLFLYSTKPSGFSSGVGFIIVVLIAILIFIFNIEQFVDSFFIKHQYNISIYIISMSFGLLVGWLFWRQKPTNTIH